MGEGKGEDSGSRALRTHPTLPPLTISCSACKIQPGKPGRFQKKKPQLPPPKKPPLSRQPLPLFPGSGGSQIPPNSPQNSVCGTNRARLGGAAPKSPLPHPEAPNASQKWHRSARDAPKIPQNSPKTPPGGKVGKAALAL